MTWDSPILWSVVSIIVSLLGSYIFYRLAIKKKQLSCQYETSSLISDKTNQIADLNINYQSKKIDKLYISEVQLKNTGNTIINGDDIAPKRPLQFTTNGTFLVDKKLNDKLQKKYADNNIQIHFNPSGTNTYPTAVLDFDFISKKQSITFSLVHTGNIHFSGRIKEGDVFEENIANDIAKNQTRISSVHTYVAAIITISSVFIALMFTTRETVIMEKKLEVSTRQIQDQEETIQYLNDKIEAMSDDNKYIYENLRQMFEYIRTSEQFMQLIE